MSNIKNPCIDCINSFITTRIGPIFFKSTVLVCSVCGPHINDDNSCDDFEEDSELNIKLKLYHLSL